MKKRGYLVLGLCLAVSAVLVSASARAQGAREEIKVEILDTPLRMAAPSEYPPWEVLPDEAGDDAGAPPHEWPQPSQAPLRMEYRYVATFRAPVPGIGASEPVVLSRRQRGRISNILLRALKKVPRDQLPSEDTRQSLVTQFRYAIQYRPVGEHIIIAEVETEEGMERGTEVRSIVAPVVEFRVLAATAQRAEELARLVVLVYNEGYAGYFPKEHARRHEQAKARRPEIKRALETARQRLDDVQRRLNELPRIDADAVAALETKKWLLSVDIAGTKARIEAIDRLQADDPAIRQGLRVPTRYDEFRIPAHLDLADFKARYQEVKRLLELAERREALMPEHNEAKKQVEEAESAEAKNEQAIVDYGKRAQSFLYEPLRVVHNTITVQPIEWEETSEGTPAMFEAAREFGAGAPREGRDSR